MMIRMQGKYGKREEERHLCEYAQHNEDCKRIWGKTEVSSERGEFQRDRERIVNSKAFRRMVDKAQIFTASKGDHYRSRMTHTMEVAQIARSIANSLRLNIDLTEAIALGHDIGHTPFGHQGERTLQDILNHKIDVGLPGIQGHNIYGGFKHNFQSVRTLNCLEEKYVSYKGLDISYQVLEGVLKHTDYRQKKCEECTYADEGTCPRECCDLTVFLDSGEIQELYLDILMPTTLEGQVVAIADEIAQRSHDIDDAMSAGLLSYEQLHLFLEKNEAVALLKIIEKTHNNISESEREFISQEQMVCARIISDIVNYLVNDVVKESSDIMNKWEENDFYQERRRFSVKLIQFSTEGNRICDLLESMVKQKVLNNPEIAKFDFNADNIVKGLFHIYYQNPRLMHVGILKRISIEIKDATGEKIDLVDGEPGKIQKELESMCRIDSRFDGTEDRWKKHIILVRAIADYIAGMTDSYARDEYTSFFYQG